MEVVLLYTMGVLALLLIGVVIAGLIIDYISKREIANIRRKMFENAVDMAVLKEEIKTTKIELECLEAKENFRKENRVYKERFKTIPVEQKRRDLLVHPMIDHDRIKDASDDEVEQVYHTLFSSMDMAMRNVIGESMFDENYV